MEVAGLGFDPWLLRAAGEAAREAMARLERESAALAGRSFNLASPSQLADVLYNVLQVHQHILWDACSASHPPNPLHLAAC
jgi:DNA polymerase I-like protein with 3'-5' exonuclease and polymerase domains